MVTRIPHLICIVISIFVSSMCWSIQPDCTQWGDYLPEEASGIVARRVQQAKDFMVSAANPVAVKTGVEIINKGGNAIDAAIAMQLVLNLVEPQSSGLGGGAFMLYHDAKTNKLTAYDGRETAPANIDPKQFLDVNGQPIHFWQAVVGGHSVGAPGIVKLLETTHQLHGQLPWAELFQPAMQLAKQGFPVSKRLYSLLQGGRADRLKTYKNTREYFFPNGQAITPGSILKNLDFANTLEKISQEGSQYFYSGNLAREIVNTVQNSKPNPGRLSLSDLKNYKIQVRKPFCFPYHQHTICTMGPPSSAGHTLAQIMGLIAPFKLQKTHPYSPSAWHVFLEAAKLSYADRAVYLADQDFINIPAGLISETYLQHRRSTIQMGQSLKTPVPFGDPEAPHIFKLSPDTSLELPCTSHFAIVDKQGNAVSMTTTIENGFGSNLMVGGFLLNNQLTDFSFQSEANGQPIANRIEPNKRPRSSMAPTIVYDHQNKIKYMLGSSGGSNIILHVAKALIALIDWNLNIQQAFDLGHVFNKNDVTHLEKNSNLSFLEQHLRDLGHDVVVKDLNSGLQGIAVEDQVFYGGSDPRREGISAGG